MATEKISFCIGYTGMTLQYHTIEIVIPSASISKVGIVKKKFEEKKQKEVMLSPRRKFFQIHKPKNKKRESKNKFKE